MNIDSLWMTLSIASVMLMIPGLGFFYTGFARSQHSLSSMMKCFIVLGPCSLAWVLIGDSLVFGESFLGVIGNASNIGLIKIYQNPERLLFSIFQLLFSLIAVAIISGSVIERVRFNFWIVFAILWNFVVYYPVAHWVWGKEGWIEKLGAVDFAGGLVVHVTSGVSALVLAKKLGRRLDFFRLRKSYNIGMVFLGTTFLFLGWLGFNGGSALKFDHVATIAIINTIMSVFSGLTTWMIVDAIFTPHKITSKGVNIAVVCSLVGITPGAGYLSIYSALLIGATTSLISNLGIRYFHSVIKIDDSNDVFISHGIGGIVGAILTGLLASSSINPTLLEKNHLLQANLIASFVVAVYSGIATTLLYSAISYFIKPRVTRNDEDIGLDLTQHGENIIIIRSE